MNLEGFKSDDVRSINISTYKIASKHNDYHPQTVEALRQSLPVATAICLLNGDLNMDNLKINSEIISIASKVAIKYDQGLDHLYPLKRPSLVTVTTKNKSYNCRVDLPLGEPEQPLHQSHIIDKFHNLNPEVDLNVLKAINKLESYKMRDLMSILNRKFKSRMD
jgi:2-methylcitrate dehydratase PrpD